MKSGRMKRILLSVIAFLFVGCSIAGGTALLSNTSISDSNRGGDSTPSENEITKNAPTNSDLWTNGHYATAVDNEGEAGIDGTTEEKAYEIRTAEQLALLAYRINTSSTNSTYKSLYYVQTADIDLSLYYWEPIGDMESRCFSGNYNGGGFKILGMYTEWMKYSGLFGCAINPNSSNTPTISNVNIANSFVDGYGYVGAVVGYAKYYAIKNCSNAGDVSGISSTWSLNVGGIVGDMSYAGTGAKVIESCYNRGSIIGNASGGVGGIAGSSVYIEKCRNEGRVESTSARAGGIVAYCPNSISECYNSGNVIAKSMAAGILCYGGGSVSNSYNVGEISGDEAGGIICDVPNGVVNRCYNAGTINGNSYAGGIVAHIEGYLNWYGSSYSNIENCVNIGDVVGEICGAFVAEAILGSGTNKYGYYENVKPQIISCYYGLNCNVEELYGTGEAYVSDCGECTSNDVISIEFYINNANWNENAWDFENVWTFVEGMNDGLPILQWSVDIIKNINVVSEIYNDAEGKMDEENVGQLFAYLLGESEVDVTAKETMDKLNALAGSTMTSADIRDKNKGTDITVRFGGLDWTVTYLSKDNAGNNILTLWLSSSQQDAFAGRSRTEGELYGFINNSLYSDWSADYYDDATNIEYPFNMYGTSYIRAVTLNNGGVYATETLTLNATKDMNNAFARFTIENDNLSNSLTKFLVKPSKVGWQINQNAINEGVATSYLSNESMNDPALDGDNNWSSESYNYHKKNYYDAWGNDYLWLPSLSEVGYNNTHSGIWQISTIQRMNFSLDDSQIIGGVGADNTLNGGYVRNRIWLRSAYINTARGVYALLPSGDSCANGYVSGSFGVRPALHLNLNKVIRDVLGVFRLTLDDNGGSGGDGEIFVTEDGYYADEGVATKIESVTVPSFTAHKFLGYFTDGGQQVTDANGVIIMTSSQFTEATTLYAHWEAKNPAYYDSEGGYWYIENGKLPQSKVSDSLKSTLSGQWASLAVGSVYYMGIEELANSEFTSDGGMQSKVYNGEEYVKFNGEYYLVEPIRWRLVYSSSQKEGYAVENTSILSTMAEIVFVGSYSSTKIGVGAGYSAESVTMLLKNQVSTEFLVNENREVEIFRAPKDTTTASGSVFVASSEELASFTTSKNNTTGSGVKAGKASFSDFVKDYLRATGQGNYYFTRDLGDQLNTIRCLNPVGNRSQAKAQQTLGVQFTIKVTEYACKSV